MVSLRTDLKNLKESARTERVELSGTITATDVQKALENLDTGKLTADVTTLAVGNLTVSTSFIGLGSNVLSSLVVSSTAVVLGVASVSSLVVTNSATVLGAAAVSSLTVTNGATVLGNAAVSALTVTNSARVGSLTVTTTAAVLGVLAVSSLSVTGTAALLGATTISSLTVTGTARVLGTFGIQSTGAAFDLQIVSSEVLTASRSLDIAVNNANRAINLSGNLSFGGDFTASGAFAHTQRITAATDVTLPTSGKLDTDLNLGLAASVGANALTIAIKDAAGNDPTAASPVTLDFRNAALTTGTPSRVSHTVSASLVISSGSTLGAANGVPFRLWIVDFNDAGTLRPGVIKCSTTAGVIAALDDAILGTSTAEGGAGGADSAGIFYTGSTVTAKAYRTLGYMEWANGLTTAGTWDAGPTKIQIFGPGVKKPGEVVQALRSSTTTSTTITSMTYTNTNVSVTITPTSKINLIDVTAIGAGQIGGVAENLLADLHRDSTQIGVGITMGAAANLTTMIANTAMDSPASTSAIVYMVKILSNAGATVTYPAGGHVENGAIVCKEIMA